MFDIAVACLVVTALFAYVNERWIRLPGTVGVMTIAMVLSLGLVVTHHLGWEFAYRPVTAFLNDVDFSAMLMDGMLSLLLFAGALHVRFDQLRSYRLAVLALSIVATLVSTVIVGFRPRAIAEALTRLECSSRSGATPSNHRPPSKTLEPSQNAWLRGPRTATLPSCQSPST